MATTLQEAYKRLESDSELKHRFTEDPAGTLKSLGVDTSSLNISKISDQHATKVNQATVCFSIGEIVCFSVG
jgi:hypothetical protein